MSASHPRFCLDELSLSLLDVESRNFASSLEDFALQIAGCHRDNQVVVTLSDFFDIPIWSAIWGEGWLDKEQNLLLLQSVSRCPEIDSEVTNPLAEVSLVVSGDKKASQAAAFALSCLDRKLAVACLCAQTEEFTGGYLPVTREGKDAGRIHFICDRSCKVAFYREVPEIEDISETDYIKHASLAFPDLCLAPELSRQFRRFQSGYRDVRPRVTEHLAMLNDHMQDVFSKHQGLQGEISREIKSTYGIDLSRDSKNERKISATRRNRTVQIEGEDIYCSWHTKISPTHDRIYFEPDRDKVVIGIFHLHL